MRRGKYRHVSVATCIKGALASNFNGGRDYIAIINIFTGRSRDAESFVHRRLDTPAFFYLRNTFHWSVFHFNLRFLVALGRGDSWVATWHRL